MTAADSLLDGLKRIGSMLLGRQDSVSSKDSLLEQLKANPSFDSLVTSGALDKMTLPQGDRLRPMLVICETVNVCNQDCVFCPYSQQTRQKGVMSMDIFARAVKQYAEMGGGVMSVTPVVGDILLDRLLMERVALFESVRNVITPTVTTNLVALHRYDDDQIRRMIQLFKRFHISCYGLTEEENNQITRRNHLPQFLINAKRFIKLWEDCGRACEVRIGFRNLHEHSEESLDKFVMEVFGCKLEHSAIRTYANWGNAMAAQQLPGDAQWVEPRQNSTPCVLLAAAMQIFWDGRVTCCACCDYDASEELALGNIQEESLIDLFNGYQSQALWQAHGSGQLPKICAQCTFHLPLQDLTPEHSVVANPVEFIGG